MSEYRKYSKTIETSSGTIHYLERANAEARKTILLIHGAPCPSFGYMRLIKELSSDFRVIAIDLPGFGESKAKRDFDHTLAAYSSAVVDFVSELGLKDFYLYLNDSGGCIGLHAASSFAADLKAVILSGTIAFPLVGKFTPVRLMLKYIVGNSFFAFINRKFNLLPRLVSTKAARLHPFTQEEQQFYCSLYPTAESRDRILHLFKQMGSNKKFLLEVETAIMEKLSPIPLLMIYGTKDPMRKIGAPEHFDTLFSNSKLIEIPQEQHFPHLASADRIAKEIISWNSKL